jgi:hypothetical protein
MDTDKYLGEVTANRFDEAEGLASKEYGHLAPNGLVVFDEEFWNEMKRD